MAKKLKTAAKAARLKAAKVVDESTKLLVNEMREICGKKREDEIGSYDDLLSEEDAAWHLGICLIQLLNDQMNTALPHAHELRGRNYYLRNDLDYFLSDQVVPACF